MNIQMQPVQSSQIAEVGYDPGSKTLAVRFNAGGLYHYDGVPQETFDGMLGAESVGAYFGQNVRGAGFDFQKIEEGA